MKARKGLTALPRLLLWGIPIGLFAGGSLVFVVGFVWWGLFVGIPYQDPPPELAARYDFHNLISSRLMMGGFLTASAGFLGICLVAVWSSLRRLARKFEGPDE